MESPSVGCGRRRPLAAVGPRGWARGSPRYVYLPVQWTDDGVAQPIVVENTVAKELKGEQLSEAEESKEEDPAETEGSKAEGPKVKRVTSRLNVDAKPWKPAPNIMLQSTRSMFLTFSNGQPITEDEIFNFFTSQYGDVVDYIYVHSPSPRSSYIKPQFGKIRFKQATLPTNILKETGERKFMVDAKPMWCKRFDPTKFQPRSVKPIPTDKKQNYALSLHV